MGGFTGRGAEVASERGGMKEEKRGQRGLVFHSAVPHAQRHVAGPWRMCKGAMLSPRDDICLLVRSGSLL